ncbi:MAG: type I 3-dehydroquinate dehydratase [Verrucomicrobium sp.]|nr:type I 3-dehydroquinate dehydratase [Verrucomicrobium sp.]
MAQLVSSKNLFSGDRPLVVGAISSSNMLEGVSQISLISDECDILELRLDSILLPVAELHAHASHLPLPVLITARHAFEGGDQNLSVEARSALLEAHLDVATLMDVELRSAMELQTVIRKAQAKNIAVLGSFHDFNATPSDEVLKGAVDMALQFRFDAVKIATMLRTPADLARLVTLVANERRLPVSIMGMGPLGRTSRLVLAKCGSVLNYGYLGSSNAPGQWPARRLKELLQEL